MAFLPALFDFLLKIGEIIALGFICVILYNVNQLLLTRIKKNK